MQPIPLITKPGPKKQELLNKFSWLRTFLITFDQVDMSPRLKTATIETVWNAQTVYLQADDDDYNYNVALEAYHMLENGFMSAGIDVEAGIRLAMQRNGHSNLNQMKPVTKELVAAIDRFDDPWS